MNLKTPALHFSVDEKHFKDRKYRKQWRHYDHVISPTTVIGAFSISSSVVWAESITSY